MPGEKGFGEEPEESWGLLHTEVDGQIIRKKYPSYKGNFGMYYDELYETIVNGAPLAVTPEHGLYTIQIIESALESNRKQCSIAFNPIA